MLRVAFALLVALTCGAWRNGAGGADVITHLYDAGRTGWNFQEQSLTPGQVASAQFGALCARIDLDGDVDAQPLFVRKVSISGTVYDVLYIATGNNTIYAIDVTTCGTITSVNLGTAVDGSHIYGGTCQQNPSGSKQGIAATPVIDIAANTMYVLASTWTGSNMVLDLHALALDTLADKVAAKRVTATGTLADASTYTFNGNVSRSRPGLALANGTVYAAFASFCDFGEDTTRGWLLGWNATTLNAIANNELTNKLATGDVYLTSIWMSGAAPAVDAGGNIYVVTGNGGAGTYNPPTAIQETAAKFTADLSTLSDYFTPFNQEGMDVGDSDFGSSGITVLPDQAGVHPHLAVAGNKDGNLYLLDRDNMGHYVNGGPDAVLGTYSMGGCWCTNNYYVGHDGVPRVLSNGGDNSIIWTLATAPAGLTSERTLPAVVGGGYGDTAGFFSSISSNQRNNHVIWTVSHDDPIKLFAFDPTNGTTLFSATAGNWVTGRVPNLVPVVAGGRVFVASSNQLYAFGMKPAQPASYTGPGDVVSGALAWWGLRGYSAAYAAPGTNKAVNIRRDSDNATRDIVVLRSGALDVASASSFCTATDCYVTKAYDQTGNGCDLVNADTATQPQLVFNANGSLPLMQYFQGVLSQLTCATFPVTAQPLSVSVVVEDTLGAGDSSIISFYHNGGEPYLHFQDSSSITMVAASSFAVPYTVDNLVGIQAVFNGAGSVARIGGVETTGNVGAGGAGAFVGVGNDPPPGATLIGYIGEAGVWGSAFNSTQRFNLCANQRTYQRIPITCYP